MARLPSRPFCVIPTAVIISRFSLDQRLKIYLATAPKHYKNASPEQLQLTI
jgi:hypothetical protein